MVSNKKPLTKYLVIYDERNSSGEYGKDAIRGIATSKVFIPTKANLEGVSLTNYKVVRPKMFAYVPDTSRRGDKISLAYNDSNEIYLVSSISVVFEIDKNKLDELMPEYLYMFFKRKEFDRYSRFNSWGSAREAFSWEDFCSTEIIIPSHSTQQKLVDIYLGIQENLDAMTRGVEQMHRACDAFMQRLLDTVPKATISTYIEQTDIRNYDLAFGIDDVRGISIEKKFIDTKANMAGVSLLPYKVVAPREFSYVTVTSRNGDKVSIALNDSNDTYIVSSSYVSFKIINSNLIPEYLFMFLRTPAFDRYARFNSWGSARETFALEDLGRYEIPIPSRDIQQDIVNIFNAYNTRRQLVDKLAALQKRICPILIKGATEEGGR